MISRPRARPGGLADPSQPAAGAPVALPGRSRPSYAALADLARRAGVPQVPETLVHTPDEAAQAARRLGFPVALALDLATAGEVRSAGVRLLGRTHGVPVEGLLVQRMVAGVEVLVGVTREATFGPLLVIGAGGVQAELLADTACRPLPVSRQEIVAMLGEVRALGALRGYRGRPPADVPALVRAIAGVTRLARQLGPRLVSLDANPIVVRERGRGAFAVDLLVVLTGDACHLSGQGVLPRLRGRHAAAWRRPRVERPVKRGGHLLGAGARNEWRTLCRSHGVTMGTVGGGTGGRVGLTALYNVGVGVIVRERRAR